ncbi:PTS system lichenan oligosaccharide-specific IIA component (Lac family) [Streptohalobacillus salinus]|uniref:PTS system lichenan oligosaccharide-specific IIA component (Lac family) n=1 Tax=Streptohalobacillus salinus TaxID=621096 RepID=A0A2V3WG39_9BACI|nr:PTS lactose/cellobiose transporter subunit IIA [Streptohalobacillus salinus]PXW92220.1 PTS system lichenan oligosaccharide-specific IIA component (Lac family) [Streptohalobacillus salinus]
MAQSMTEIAFQIILFAGNGKSSAMEAIHEAKEGNFEEADNKIKEASEELSRAHRFQTELLQQEASGESKDINIILIHSQDHLMTSMTVRDLAIEIIEIYRTRQ